MHVRQGPVTSTRRLEEEAQILCNEVSSKFVIKPSIEEVRSDTLICLKRFSASVRSKYHALEREKANKATISGGKTPSYNQEGVETGLRPTNGWTPDSKQSASRSRELEAFLLEFEQELLDHLDEMAKIDTRKPNKTTAKIDSFMTKLRTGTYLVLVPTDNTNSVKLIATTSYSNLVIQHLQKDAKLTDLVFENKVKKNAIAYLEQNKLILLDQEYNYIRSTINKCAVPTIQLLIKDHKKGNNKNGNYFTRLVVPAKNFTAAFPYVGQQGIEKILNRNKIDHSRKSIIQASDLKQQLENPNIRKSKHTVISIDAEKMYPSIKFG